MSESSPRYFRWERRVEFCETDAAGIVHFSSFFLYMEQAEHALFRALGTSIFPADFHRSGLASPPFTWPRVRCECEYFAPAHFEDTLSIFVGIERLGAKSVTYRHDLQLNGGTVARGRIVAVCSMHDSDTGRLVGCPIPESLKQSLSQFLVVDGSQ